MARSQRRRPRRRPSSGWAYLVVALVLSGLLYSVYGLRQAIPLQAGEPSPETFVAPNDVQVVDRIATQRQRQAVRDQIAPVYSVDHGLQQLVTSSVSASTLPEEVTEYVLERYRAPNGVTEAQREQVIDEAVALAPESARTAVRLTLQRRLAATAHVDERLTAAARDAAAASVDAVYQRLQEGDVIVEAGQPVTEEQLRALEALGLYDPSSRQLRQTAFVVLGCLLVGMLLALPTIYVARALRNHLTFAQLLFLIGTTLVVLVLQRLGFLISSELVFALLVPLTVAALAGEVAALIWAGWLALAVGLLVPGAPLQVAAGVLIASLTATLFTTAVRNRTSLLLAGAAGGVAGGATLVFLQLMNGGLAPLHAASQVAQYTAGGALAGVVALGLLPVAESAFDFLTDFRLIELSSPHSALQQKLLLDAPGTYQHSQLISNLVEQAVKAIGGNALLARVGALYHDVGKTKRPQFFVENQISGENPHDRLSPHLSYLIITSHVRDGVELLRRYRMPNALEPFVNEHHGTTVLVYFYKRALEDAETLDELNFRYPGPKPRSKETAVLLLADAVESASRTLGDPTQGSVRAMIDRLFDERLQDEQLSESPLNFHDLEVIANTFERMLTASLHRRIRYPSAEEIKGLRRGGSSRPDAPVSSG